MKLLLWQENNLISPDITCNIILNRSMGLHLRNTCTNTSQGSPLPEELLEYVNKEPYLILDCRTACSQRKPYARVQRK